MINYCEWYYNPKGADIGFNKENIDCDRLAMTRCNNFQFLQDLLACDMAISPTYYQKAQFPKIFQDKIKVIHDGINTDYFMPNSNASFKIPNSDIILTQDDEVITYVARGMEPYRAFAQFMEIADILLQKRPNLHIIIVGEDRGCYGPKLANGTYKEIMLKKFNPVMARLHFTGDLPYMDYKKVLEISSVHCYLTYPFVLSWSILEAMSTGCLIVASKTEPVEEIIKNGENGFLVDFYDVDGFAWKIENLLDNKEPNQRIRNAARKTIVEKYDLKKLLPKHIEVIKNMTV